MGRKVRFILVDMKNRGFPSHRLSSDQIIRGILDDPVRQSKIERFDQTLLMCHERSRDTYQRPDLKMIRQLHYQLELSASIVIALIKRDQYSWSLDWSRVSVQYDDVFLPRPFYSRCMNYYGSVACDLLDTKFRVHGFHLLTIPKIWYGSNGVGAPDAVRYDLGCVTNPVPSELNLDKDTHTPD
jgi:hypothetical protein